MKGNNSGIRPIDHASPIPYYYQLQELLKEEIEHGRWKPGELLPSEADLASTLRISRTVIRQALDVLEADGQVYRVKGKGTVVAQPKFRYEAIAAAQGFTKGGRQPQPRLSRLVDVRRVAVGAPVGRLLHLPPQARVYELTFAEAVGKAQAALSHMFLREDASSRLETMSRSGAGLPKLENNGPEALIQLAEKYGVEIVESQITVEATLANDFEAEVLDVRIEAPMFLLSSVDLRSDATPVAFTRTVVRSDQFRFSIVIRRNVGLLGNLRVSLAV